MDFRVNVSTRAISDANSILEWLLLQDAGEAGLRWFHKLEEAIASLSSFPARCKLAPESASVPFELRQLLYGHRPHLYRILFTIEGSTVNVLHIRHGRRSLLDGPH